MEEVDWIVVMIVSTWNEPRQYNLSMKLSIVDLKIFSYPHATRELLHVHVWPPTRAAAQSQAPFGGRTCILFNVYVLDVLDYII